MNRTSNHNINSIMLYHWAIKALITIKVIMRTKELHQYILIMSQLCYCYISPHLHLNILHRKERNWTFDSKRLLSLQLNPSYQQTEPSFCILIHIYSLLLKCNQPRAISTTRTVFRLNTNQSHAYEDLP